MFSPPNSLATPFGSTVMSPMVENGLAPFEGGSESPWRVKAKNELFQFHGEFSEKKQETLKMFR